MSISSNAYIFYGIPFPEDLDMEALAKFHGVDRDSPEGDCFPDDWTQLYAKRIGIPPPEAFIKYEDYYDICRIRYKESGCEMGIHCHSDYPIYYLYITEAHYKAYRGDTTKVGQLGIVKGWDEKLRRYCELMGLPWAEPNWYLVSYMG